MKKENLDRLFKFIHERYLIALRKRAGKPKPWTEDKILQRYRFCNIYREWDKVTVWIAENWRDNHRENPDLWFAMCVARFINWPPTLAHLGFPVPWDAVKFKEKLRWRKKKRLQIFTGAYIIPSNGPKISYIADKVLTPLWKKRLEVRPREGDTLQRFFERLREFNGFGSFMTGQVIADIKYVGPLLHAIDWFDWATSGPGSRRGLNRVLGNKKSQPWREFDWRLMLGKLHHDITPMIEKAGMPLLHAQDLQNCLCEYDKWCRVYYGEGRPRSRYPGEADTKELL